MDKADVLYFENPKCEVSKIEVSVISLKKKVGRPSTASSFAHVGPKIDKNEMSPGKLKILKKDRHRQLQKASSKRFRDRQKLKQGKIEIDLFHELNRKNKLNSEVNQIENEISEIRLQLLDIHPEIDFTEIFMQKYKEDANFDISLLVQETIAKCCKLNEERPGKDNVDILSIAMKEIDDNENQNHKPAIDTTLPIPLEDISIWDLLDN